LRPFCRCRHRDHGRRASTARLVTASWLARTDTLRCRRSVRRSPPSAAAGWPS
jgi:hypothetical protein